MTLPPVASLQPDQNKTRSIEQANLLRRGIDILGWRQDSTTFYLRFRAPYTVDWVRVQVQSTAAGEGGLTYSTTLFHSSTEMDCRTSRTQDVTVSSLDLSKQYIVFLIPVQKDGAGVKVKYDGVSGPDNMSYVGTLTAEEIPDAVVPAALTRVNDTNVTVTLGGTPNTALLQATSLTLGWTGTLSVTRGGTGANLSATGGTSQVLRQSSAGAAITVSQLAFTDISSTMAYAQLPTGSGSWDVGSTNVLTLRRSVLMGNGSNVFIFNSFDAISGLTSQLMLDTVYIFGSNATVSGMGLRIQLGTVASAFTQASMYTIRLLDPSKGAGSTITTNHALYIDSQLQGATNYAIFTNTGLVHFGDRVDTTEHYRVDNVQVVSNRITGYVAMTGAGDKGSTFDTSTVSLTQLAQRVKQLQDDITTHGLVGT